MRCEHAMQWRFAAPLLQCTALVIRVAAFGRILRRALGHVSSVWLYVHVVLEGRVLSECFRCVVLFSGYNSEQEI